MFQLTIKDRPYPARYEEWLDGLLIDSMSGFLDAYRCMPIIIRNADRFIEEEEHAPLYLTTEVGAFGFFLSVYWLGYHWGGRDARSDEPLPDEVIAALRDRVLPDPFIDPAKLDDLLDGMTPMGLSRLESDLEELSDSGARVKGIGGHTEYIVDLFHEAWGEFCLAGLRHMRTIRLTFLDVTASDLNRALSFSCQYLRGPYGGLLLDLEAMGLDIVSQQTAYIDAADEAGVKMCDPVRGGGFTCIT